MKIPEDIATVESSDWAPEVTRRTQPRFEFPLRRVPLAVFDLGLLQVIDPRILLTYLVIRGYEWHSDDETKELSVYFNHGELVASVSQRKLGRAAGVGRQRGNRLIQELRQLGWLEAVPVPWRPGGALLYRLGRVHGKEHTYFFDLWLRELARRLREVPQRDERQTILAFVNETKAGRWVASSARQGVSPGKDMSCRPKTTAPCRRTRTQRTQKGENTEKKKLEDGESGMRRQLAPRRKRKARIVEFIPDREGALRRLDRVMVSAEDRRWGVPELFGLYVLCWEKRYRTLWTQEPRSARKVEFENLKTLHERVGVEEAKKAVRVVFENKSFNNQSNLLAHEANYKRMVLPLVAVWQRPGEQAEWEGPRGERGSETIRI